MTRVVLGALRDMSWQTYVALGFAREHWLRPQSESNVSLLELASGAPNPYELVFFGSFNYLDFLASLSTPDPIPIDGRIDQLQPSSDLSSTGGFTFRATGLRAKLDQLETAMEDAAVPADVIPTAADAPEFFALLNRGRTVVIGGSGPDVLSGGAGVDRLKGRGGNDLFLASESRDRIDGGRGRRDEVDFSDLSTRIELRLDAGEAETVKLRDGRGGTPVEVRKLVAQLSRVEEVVGTRWDDLLIGDRARNVLAGGEGKDTLRGLGADDEIHGGAGRDVLNGGPGDDTLSGGEGVDRLLGGAERDTFVFARGDAGPGRDRIGDFDVADDRIDFAEAPDISAVSGARHLTLTADYGDGDLVQVVVRGGAGLSLADLDLV